MMSVNFDPDYIPRKYACAFLNVYMNVFDHKCYNSLLLLSDFFKKNRVLSVYLNMPVLPDDAKQDVLNKVFESLGVCKTIKLLVRILLSHGKMEILPRTITHIIRAYRKRKNMFIFSVFTSHQLLAEEEKKIIHFLERATRGIIDAHFSIDPTLLCGVRLYGEFLLWECSLAQMLRKVKRSTLQRVGLW